MLSPRLISATCFDPTYKGWKLESIGLRDSRDPCFDPTYKGWKLFILKDVPNKLNSFDPTYKGWKRLLSLIELNTAQNALILPTRDGNVLSPINQERLEFCFDPTYKGWKLGW